LDVNLSAKAVTSKPFDVSRIPANYDLEMLSVTLAELKGFRRCRNAAPLRSDFMERIVTQRRLNFQTR